MIISAPIKMRQLEFVIRSWGGRRVGAGRPSKEGRRSVAHRRRILHDAHCPVHVTLRALREVGSLRDAFAVVRRALAAGSRGGFRVVHFSVQHDHLHLLVEGDSHAALRAGVQGLAIGIAKAINSILGRRGRVWADRYHARQLSSPREMRNALVYVLQNWRKHVPGARELDPCSSAAWFAGWQGASPPAVAASSPVVEARTWLGRTGWRRYGRLGIDEVPRVTPRAMR